MLPKKFIYKKCFRLAPLENYEKRDGRGPCRRRHRRRRRGRHPLVI
jgi:hypothetical protein